MATVLNTSFMLSTVRHSYNKTGVVFDIVVGILGIIGCYGLSLLPLDTTLAILLFVSILGVVLILWMGKEYLYARKAR